MNKKQLLLKRAETWRRFHTPSMANYCKRKKNAVFISPSNSLKHEQAKLEVCWHLRKLKHEFITEAVCNATRFRHDVVDLDTRVIYEIETTVKRARRFESLNERYKYGIIVIPLWKKSVEIKKYLVL